MLNTLNYTHHTQDHWRAKGNKMLYLWLSQSLLPNGSLSVGDAWCAQRTFNCCHGVSPPPLPLSAAPAPIQNLLLALGFSPPRQLLCCCCCSTLCLLLPLAGLWLEASTLHPQAEQVARESPREQTEVEPPAQPRLHAVFSLWLHFAEEGGGG